MALTLRYFNDFAKPAFRLITASSSIELIYQNSASVTHRAVKLSDLFVDLGLRSDPDVVMHANFPIGITHYKNGNGQGIW